jgi:hypothetical protein
MTGVFLLAVIVILQMPMTASAQTAFDGTWKIDTNKVDFPKNPDVYLLQNGVYECKTCVPPYKVKADGTDQSVGGNPHLDTVAVSVVSDHEIVVNHKKNGKVVSTSTWTVSSDGKSLMFTFNDSSEGGAAAAGRGEATRVADGPAGSGAISGSWRTTKMENVPPLTWTYKLRGDALTMTVPTGQSITAKLDGTDTPVNNDPGASSVSVKIVSKDTLEVTNKRDGKIIAILKMTVAADGKSAKVIYDDKLQDTRKEVVARKQSQH